MSERDEGGWQQAGPSDYAEGGYYGQGEPGGFGRPPGLRRPGGRRHEGGYDRGAMGRRDSHAGDWRRGYGGYGMGGPDWGGSGDYGSEGGWGGGGTEPAQGADERAQADRSRYSEPWSVPGPFTGRGPEGYRRSAEAIRDEVCERLTRHGELDASRIRVNVEGDEVVLEGTVSDRRAKRMAEDTAETVSGVHDVHNRLRIQGRDADDAG